MTSFFTRLANSLMKRQSSMSSCTKCKGTGIVCIISGSLRSDAICLVCLGTGLGTRLGTGQSPGLGTLQVIEAKEEAGSPSAVSSADPSALDSQPLLKHMTSSSSLALEAQDAQDAQEAQDE